MSRRSKTGDKGVHTHVHISVCPNQEMHLRIGNICLHLCKQDFRRLARAVMDAAAQAEDWEREEVLGSLH